MINFKGTLKNPQKYNEKSLTKWKSYLRKPFTQCKRRKRNKKRCETYRNRIAMKFYNIFAIKCKNISNTYFSNHRVRLVVCRIIFRRLGELISLSSFVHTLPTNSDGCTALKSARYNSTWYFSPPGDCFIK